MTLYPHFEIAGWNGHSDALDRLELELRCKRSRQRSHRRIMHIEDGFVADSGTQSTLSEATKSLVLVFLAEIPDYLPQTIGAHPAEQECCTGLEQFGEIPGKLSQVVNTVQCTEIRKCSIE
jgi:hypothetical protein